MVIPQRVNIIADASLFNVYKLLFQGSFSPAGLVCRRVSHSTNRFESSSSESPEMATRLLVKKGAPYAG